MLDDESEIEDDLVGSDQDDEDDNDEDDEESEE